VLLLIAKKHIPEDLWAKTPFTFRATAGVRLLNDKEAEGLLSHVRFLELCFSYLLRLKPI
jgi:Golgi nucleoside diphosphatase